MFQPLPQRELVLLGAGHTHLHILNMWKMHPIADVRLTCVSNQLDASYSGMLPGVLAGDYSAEQMKIDLIRRGAAVGARLLLAQTTDIDQLRRQILFKDRAPIRYDCLSIGIGSRPHEVPGLEHALSIKPMQTFLNRLQDRVHKAVRQTERPVRVTVVGGGAGGVEIALCFPSWLKRHFASTMMELTVVHRGQRILSGGSRRAARIVQRLFDQRGYRTLLKHNAVMLTEQTVEAENSLGVRESCEADIVIWAVGAIGPRLFESLGLAQDDKGFLLTNRYLQSVDDDRIFVVGDSGTCVARPHPKAGVYAVRQGPLLWKNLQRRLESRPLAVWKPQGDFLSLLNSGDQRAVLQYKGLAVHNRWCWRLKDFIDRRFMDKHQDYQPARMRTAPAMPQPSAAMRCDGCGGKLSSLSLRRVLERLDNPPASHVRLGLSDAEDVAALCWEGGDCAEHSDVITTTDFFAAFLDDAYLVGRVAALNALSDLFAKGSRPRAAIAQAVIPSGSAHQQEQVLFELLAGSLAELRPLGVPIVGGHTIEGEQLVIGFTLLGDQSPEKSLRLKSRLCLGDHLVLTKPLGTGVLLAAHRLARCSGCDFGTLVKCMLQSNRAAGEVADACELQAATDVTGFGLMGHLIEMLQSSHATATIDLHRVPLLPGAKRLLTEGMESSLAPANREAAAMLHSAPEDRSGAYQALFDPQTSGGLLLAVPDAKLPDVISRLQHASEISPAIIGRVGAPGLEGRPLVAWS